MANYIVNGNDLTLVADSIRSKGNTSGELVWPTGFKNAIDNISVDVKDICIKTTDFDDVVKVDDAAALDARDVVAKIEPVQDLHGYDSPWPEGGRKNKANPAEAQNNKWIDETTGQIADANGYWVTGFIPVRYGDMVRCTTKGTIRNAWYNSDKSQATYAIYGGGNEGLFAPFDGFIVMAVASGTIAYGGNFTVTINDEDLTYSPYSNICPITGWTGAEVTRAGKNLFPSEYENGTILPDTGKPVGDSQYYRVQKIRVKPDSVYYISWTGNVENASNFRYFVYAENGEFKNAVGTASPMQISTSGGISYISFRWLKSYNLTNFQLELGSTATDYEPYQGDIFDITFPSEAGTVYGGTVDLTRGKLVVDRAMVDLGTLNWILSTSGVFMYSTGIADRVLAPASAQNIADIKCSHLVADTAYNIGLSTATGGKIGIVTNGNIRCKYDNFPTDPNQFQTSVSGFVLVYPLATPITYNLTPQEIAMFKGTNILSSTTGKTQLKYFTEAFEPLAEEIGFVNGGDY